MPPKKKKVNKKKQQEEEARRLQEELARQEAEAELKRIEEEERRKREEEERIRAYETQTRAEQFDELQEYLENIAVLYQQNRIQAWEERRWEDYVYRTKEMDTLDVKVVNSFLTNWDEDRDYDIDRIFRKVHHCLKIIDDISSALSLYPFEDRNTELWKECISSLKDIIAKKLDCASFMLLKDAKKYMNDKTQNMEYGVVDAEGAVTLCLWANLHRAARSRGVEILDFDFQIPAHLAANDCAVRIMHLHFDHVSSEVVLEPMVEEETEQDSIEIDVINLMESMQNIVENENEVPDEESQNEKTESMVAENEEVNYHAHTDGVDTKDSPAELSAEIESEMMKQISGDMEQLPNDENRFEDMKDESSPSQCPKHANQHISLREYFAVGGMLHFDLFKVPKVSIRKRGITYVHEQDPVLERIYCDREKCISSSAIEETPQTLVKNLPYMKVENEKELTLDKLNKSKDKHVKEAVKNEEDNLSTEVEKSSSHALEKTSNRKDIDKERIYLKMRIPSDVVFFENPQPALFCPERRIFTSEGISNIEYDPTSREISFMPDQFGVFGMFQRKYINFPYKNWNLKSGEIVELQIRGQYVILIIQISSDGFRIESMSPSEIMALIQVNAAWLTLEQLHEKLLSIGINIFTDEATHKFIGIPSKNQKTEHDIYSQIALLSGYCDFASSKWNCQLPSEEFVLQFRNPADEMSKEKFSLGLVTQSRATLLNFNEEMEYFNDKAVESQTFSGNLFHLILNSMQIPPPEITVRFACIENVRLLLQKCSLLSCS